MSKNLEPQTVEGFGEEWSQFDYASVNEHALQAIFHSYFRIFPWHSLPKNAIGFDVGCGSGRWAKFVAPKVGHLHCIDASAKALEVARWNLRGFSNCEFHLASLDDMPLEANSMDFGYALGVLHHLPDTAAGIKSCVSRLKPGAPFLVYIYYAFDNRPAWYHCVWRISDSMRSLVSKFPYWFRSWFSQGVAALVYYPLARLTLLGERLGFNVDMVPLSAYRSRPFYMMRNDAVDRFGTRLERRFTALQIREMMESAGLEHIEFNDSSPFWCAVGWKRL